MISTNSTKVCKGRKTQISILVDNELLKKLDRVARDEYRTRTGQILKIIMEGLK